jgi:hypothetical protein
LILGWFPPDGMPQTHTKTLTHIHRSTHTHTYSVGRIQLRKQPNTLLCTHSPGLSDTNNRLQSTIFWLLLLLLFLFASHSDGGQYPKITPTNSDLRHKSSI